MKKIILIIVISFIVVVLSIGSIIVIKSHAVKTVHKATEEKKTIKKATVKEEVVEKEEVAKEESKAGKELLDYEYNSPKYIFHIYNYYVERSPIKTYGEVNYDLDKITNIIEKNGINTRYDCNNTLMDSTITDTHKIFIALNNIDIKSLEEKKCSEVFSEFPLDKEHYTNPTYIGKTGVCPSDGLAYVVPYDRINEEYQKLNNKQLPKENIDGYKINKVHWHSFEYIPSKNVFVHTLPNNLGSCGGGIKDFIFLIKSVKEEDNHLIIEMYYTKSISHKYEQGNHVYKFKNFEIIYNWETPIDIYQEINDKYIDKLDLYNIEFQNNSGNYILTNIKKTKEA